MPLDHRRKPDSSIEKIMLRYKVIPFEEDDDEEIPTMTFRAGPMYSRSYIRSYSPDTRSYNTDTRSFSSDTRSYSPVTIANGTAPRINTATYRYNTPYKTASKSPINRSSRPSQQMAATDNTTAESEPIMSSDLERSVNRFLADMDHRRKFRSMDNGSVKQRPTGVARSTSQTDNNYNTVKGHIIHRNNSYEAPKPKQKWSKEGQLFERDVHEVLTNTRKHFMQTSPKYRPTTAGHVYTEPRNSDRFSYYTKSYSAPRSKDTISTKSKDYSKSSYQYKSKRHSTPVKDKSFQSQTPSYDNSNDISCIDGNAKPNTENDVDHSKDLDNALDQNDNKPELNRSDSRPDGLVMWEDIDLDDIVEDTSDEDDLWQKDKVTNVLEPGKFVGHGFHTEPVRMSDKEGSVTWAKPRGELDIIITQGEDGKDFVCKIQMQRQGVRVSQLMSEGEEEVLFSGKNDLETGQFRSYQGHIVLMLEALCTPFLKNVFEMNYEIVDENLE